MKTSLAYPVQDDSLSPSIIYNLKRWVEAWKMIATKEQLGFSKQAAEEEVLKDWDHMEKFNFRNWMKYYQSGDQLKYKQAQSQNSYYVNDDLNYFLPNPLQKKEIAPPSPLAAINQIPQEAAQIAQQLKPGLSQEEKHRINEDFRRKLLSRLNSVEKLLGSSQGYAFTDKEHEPLLQAVFELKKKIHTLNKINLSAGTTKALILRYANILKMKDCLGASEFMMKLAQQVPGGGANQPMGELPLGGSMPQGLGALDNNTPLSLGDLEKGDEAPKSGIDGFLDNLEGIGLTEGEDLDVNDNEDEVVFDDDVILDREIEAQLGETDLVVEAQMIDAPEETGESREVRSPKEITPKEGPEVGGPKRIMEEKPKENGPPKSKFDSLVDSAFQAATVSDLLSKLEDINAIFKNKIISQELALADLLFAKLSLTPFFPEFGEVQQKNLDCLNYSMTRLSDIIARLRGSIGKDNIDLNPEPGETNLQTAKLQEYLESQEKAEKNRKQMKKEVEKADLENKVNKPELQVESPAESLAEPTPKAVAPRPTAPVATPAV